MVRHLIYPVEAAEKGGLFSGRTKTGGRWGSRQKNRRPIKGSVRGPGYNFTVARIEAEGPLFPLVLGQKIEG